MKTLKEKRDELIKESGVWFLKSKNKIFVILRIYSEIEKQDKQFIKELLEISKENNWEVAINGGYEDGFKIISGEDWIKQKVGVEE